MGYYSNLSIEFNSVVEIDKEKLSHLKKIFSSKSTEKEKIESLRILDHDLTEDTIKDNLGYGFEDVEFSIAEKNSKYYLEDITLIEYYNKFYDSELFVHLLSKTILKGSMKFIFIGEDMSPDSIGAYEVKPGEVIYLKAIFVPEDTKIVLL